MRPPPPARGRAGGLSPTQSDTLLLGSELESVKALSALACHEHEHSRAPGCLSRRDAGLHILRRTNSVIGDRDQHTSPGCKPLSAASLLGSTRVITTPLMPPSRLKACRVSGVTAASPKPIASAVAGALFFCCALFDATCASLRAPIFAVSVFGAPPRTTLNVAVAPAGIVAMRRVRSRESSTPLPFSEITISP